MLAHLNVAILVVWLCAELVPWMAEGLAALEQKNRPDD
jgi:hypothetical protein